MIRVKGEKNRRKDVTMSNSVKVQANDQTREPAVTSRPRQVRVVIVDDHALVREGTGELLQRDGSLDVVGYAGSAEEALVVLASTPVDVALVDVNLPGQSGLELARRLAIEHPEIRVVMLSAYDEYAFIAEALDIGVAGYLLKTAGGRELIDAVHAVFDGVFVLDREVSKLLTRRHESASPLTGTLTPRETDVLEQLAKGRSNKQIASTLQLGTRTVEGYVSNVLAKLGVTSRTEAVTHAISHHLVNAPGYDYPRA